MSYVKKAAEKVTGTPKAVSLRKKKVYLFADTVSAA